MSFMSYVLPPAGEGLLPYVLYLAAISKLVNSFRTYSAGPHLVRKVYGYSTEPVTSVHSRTFATFATAFAILRLHMVFNMHDPMVYRLNVIVQAVFIAHSASEWLIYGTIGWGFGLIGPVISNVVTLVWMIWAWKQYVS